MTQDLLVGIKNMWDKMKYTSDQALRQFFFQRKGVVEYDENCHRWIVQVEKRPFDILLDSLPWSYNLVRMPWMENTIEVKWR